MIKQLLPGWKVKLRLDTNQRKYDARYCIELARRRQLSNAAPKGVGAASYVGVVSQDRPVQDFNDDLFKINWNYALGYTKSRWHRPEELVIIEAPNLICSLTGIEINLSDLIIIDDKYYSKSKLEELL